MRRRSRLLLLLLLFFPLLVGLPGCTDLTLLVNGFRAENGLSQLAEHPTLMRQAQAHASEMAVSLYLHHNPLSFAGLPEEWRLIGEVVCGPAPSAEACQEWWEASPPHRAVQLGAGYRWVGTGAALDASGRLWMVERFGG